MKEEQRIERLCQTVAKLSRKVTECNKRIDELLRSNKEIKEDLENVETAMYDLATEDLLTPAETDGEKNDEMKALAPKETMLLYDAKKSIDYHDNKRNCMCCIYKSYIYDVGSTKGTITCDNPMSKKYKKSCEYNDSCAEQITGYRSYNHAPVLSKSSYESQKITKKLLAYDFDKDETFEEIVEE